MKLYIAQKIIPYEGGYVLGVYSSEELALNRLAPFKADDDVGYYSYMVDEVELNENTEISI